MTKSESITKISAALLVAQKNIGAAVKGSENPFFKKKYADLGAIMEACKDPLNENGITVLQPIGSDESGVYVETILLHESGEFISSNLRISVKSQNDPQAQGSAISYAKRYALQSMVFIPSEDDDAEKAKEQPKGKDVPEPSFDDIKVCNAHEAPITMLKGYSKSKNKDFWYHREPTTKKICFGSGYQENKV